MLYIVTNYNIFIGDKCPDQVRSKIEAASARFLAMENNTTTKEKIFFPTKKLWEADEENKYQKSLSFLFDKLTFTVPNTNPACLVYRLLNLFFWNKA